MFIEEVVGKIWEEVTQIYQQELNIADSMDINQLYDLVMEETKQLNTVVYESSKINMIALATSGCPHNNRNNGFNGCSMCDYHSAYGKSLARINTIKRKSPELYAKIVRFSLENARKRLEKPSMIELITGYDCLNSEEIPDEVFEEMIVNGELFKRKRKPFKSVFETRASSVTLDKLLAWKKNLGKKVVVEFGVEVGNDWIRNHWINKNITNQEIKNAIDIIREADCESSANILIGIPGCTELEAIQLFKESAYWLNNLGADHILFSPLGRKERTLQGFIYRNLKDNERLKVLGLVNGEQTSIPWIFTVFEAMAQILVESPGIVEKLTLSPANFPPYICLLKDIYKNTVHLEVIELANKALTKFSRDKNIHDFISSYNDLKNTLLYQDYLELIEKQSKSKHIMNTFYTLSEEIINIFWPDEVEIKLANFKKEIELYTELNFYK